jgi:hypothetical protein
MIKNEFGRRVPLKILPECDYLSGLKNLIRQEGGPAEIQQECDYPAG